MNGGPSQMMTTISDGYRNYHSSIACMQLVPLEDQSAVATVRWVSLGHDGSVS